MTTAVFTAIREYVRLGIVGSFPRARDAEGVWCAHGIAVIGRLWYDLEIETESETDVTAVKTPTQRR